MVVLRRGLSSVFLCGLIGLGLFSMPAVAGLVSTEEVTAPAKAAEARERIKALTQRPDLAKEFQVLGIPPEQAQERVDALTDAEVLTMAGKLDSLPAGGMTNNELIIILLLIVILVIAL